MNAVRSRDGRRGRGGTGRWTGDRKKRPGDLVETEGDGGEGRGCTCALLGVVGPRAARSRGAVAEGGTQRAACFERGHVFMYDIVFLCAPTVGKHVGRTGRRIHHSGEHRQHTDEH